jgi:hypothetical protein
MTDYILVANSVNAVATVHYSNCNFLGSSPNEGTASSFRTGFHDGLEALLAAQNAMPNAFGLCGHCLKRFKGLQFQK